MLTFEEMEKELERFTYKPGWRFSMLPPLLQEFGYEYENQGKLLIEAMLVNSRGPVRLDQLIPIVSTYPTYHVRDRDQFRRWVRSCIERLERHEQMEWLRYDGELIEDPHRGDNR